jgi:hypothetical protein
MESKEAQANSPFGLLSSDVSLGNARVLRNSAAALADLHIMRQREISIPTFLDECQTIVRKPATHVRHILQIPQEGPSA